MKKVLIITYYWPPAGGAGVQRWLKLSKYLIGLDVEVHVLTVDPKYASYMQLDETLVDDVHPEIKVYKTKSFEPLKLYARLVGKQNVPTAGFSNVGEQGWKQKAISFIRSNLFIPDPRKGWINIAYKKASEIINREQIQTVITTSPPHSTQLIGKKLKTHLGIKWIADFRDPWTDIYYYPLLNHSVISSTIDKWLERKVLEHADQIITVSKGLKSTLAAKSDKVSASAITVIQNGFDPQDFIDVPQYKNEVFTLTYTGTIADQYKPWVILEVLKDLNSNNMPVKLQLVGTFSSKIIKSVQQSSVPYEIIEQVSHSDVVVYQKNADMLLLVIPDVPGSKSILTGKLFEYLASSNPILGLGNPEGDAAEIIAEVNAGRVFSRSAKAEIKSYLQDHYKHFIENGYTRKSDPIKIKKFSRRNQAVRILDLL